MGIFDFFRKSSAEDEPAVYIPNPPAQDSRQSLVDEKGRYDLSRFSPHEERIVFDVLEMVDRVYPSKDRAMGLANESYCIVYKPRYILFHIVVLRHEKSLRPLDHLAVAMAYQSKGYYFRKQAIEHFEKAVWSVLPSDMNRFLSYTPLHVYNVMSELYERDGQYEKAYKYAKLASKYSTPNSPHFASRLQKLRGKVISPPEIYHRTISKRSELFEKNIDAAARNFLQRYEKRAGL